MDPTALMKMALAGLATRYLDPEVIGRGGFGVVLRAQDARLDRPVALKLLLPAGRGDRADRDELRVRFEREAKLAARLEHPNVVRVFDHGVSCGVPFIASELVIGHDLASHLERHPDGLPVAEVLEILAQVLDGLAAAHALGILHRDIKPTNILMDSQGRARITDFGLSREEHGEGLTRQGIMVGTPAYTPLEQFLGEPWTRRGDVYSVGVLAVELLTARVPFPVEKQALARAKAETEALSLPAGRPGWSRPLRDLLARLTAREATRRPPDAAAARTLVARVRRGLSLDEVDDPQHQALAPVEGVASMRPLGAPVPPSEGFSRTRVAALFVVFSLVQIALLAWSGFF